MQLDVKFQPPFSYSKLGLICLVVLVSLIILYIIIRVIIKMNKNKNKPVVVQPINVYDIKNNYLSKLEKLKTDFNNKTITNRKAYNELSLLIRSFIFETTRIDVRKNSLSEIKKLKMDSLTELVQDYYEPEFSREGQGEFLSSIEKTKGVIERWQ